MRLAPLVDAIVAGCCRRGWWRMAETVSYYLKADHPAARIRWRSPRGNTYYLSPVHFIDRLLLSSTPHDHEVIACLEGLVRPGDVVWDAGANIGYITLELAAARPGAEYVCFEPSPLAGQQLLVNAAASGRQLQCFAAALSDRAGIFPFHLKLSRNVGQSGFVANPHTRYDRVVHVAAVVGDDLIARGLARAPDILKLDVEGHEWQALSGLRRTLEEGPTRAVLFEHCGFFPDAAKLPEFLRSRGFSLEELPGGLDNWVARRNA